MGAEAAIGEVAVSRELTGRGRGSRHRTLLVALAASLVTLCLCATQAFAARGHEFAGAFGWGVSSGASELQRCTTEPNPVLGGEPISHCQPGLQGNGPGQFDSPAGIAVNESTNEVYVVDKANDRVEIFNASGAKFEGEFNGSGSLPNEGIAAGSGGGGEEVPTGQFDEPEGIAIDNDPSSPSFGDVYVVDTNGHKAGRSSSSEEERMIIDKFDHTGKYVGQITTNPSDGREFSKEGFRELFGVSVDPQGEVWVEEQNFGEIPRVEAANYTNAVANKWVGFRSTEDPLSAFAAPGLAVDSKDNLYVHNTFGSGDRIAKFTEAGKLITPEVDEEAPSLNGVAVEAGSDDVYIAHAQSVHRISPSGTSLERLKSDGAPAFGGVAVNASTLTVYVADTAANRVDVFSPEAPGHPTIEAGSEAVLNVTATSADFSAEVNPRSAPNEEATSYRFEYGPCATPSTCSESPYPQSIPSPEGTLAPNYEPDPISAHLQGLSAGTVYHVRVAARNSHPPEVKGEELTFTTQGPPAPGLPDARRYELVSPPAKHGALILPIQGSGVIQASVSGDALSYLANNPTESDPAGFSQTVQILSRRGPGAWESQDIATPHESTVGISTAQGQGEYHFFSEDLSSAIVQPVGQFSQAISPEASERTAYLREDFPAGDPSHPCGSSCYRPLVSGCPGEGEPCPAAVQEVANVPEGTKFSREVDCREVCGAYFLGASPDASHIVLKANAALSEGANEGEGLYEWAAGKLSPVSLLPGGQPVETGSRPALGFADERESIRVARHAISADGERVVWSAGVLDSTKHPTGAHHLYLRRMTGEGTTIQLDSPEAACTAKGKCKGGGSPVFQTASADDSRIFFTDGQPLTQSSGFSDLYECKIEEGEEEGPTCKLSDLTPPGAGEEGAGVLGLLAGASEGGSALYFTANGKLTSRPSPRGEEAVAGDCNGNTAPGALESETAVQRCNLYLRSAGQTRLVAVLSGADFPDWSLHEKAGLRGLTDRVTPGGGYLAFMSRRSLSGYDNRDAVSGKPDQEVFLYDSGADRLSCASCEPSGARPHGLPYAKIDTDETGLSGGSEIWPLGAWIAADVPSGTAASNAEGFSLHQGRYLNDAGRLFFNSADALVPEDSNKTVDVYEYEPPGVGDCSTASATFGPASGGCVALISSGQAKEESAFLDASESGDDVFFLTGQRLLPEQDLDTSTDVYDAHACSSSSPCLPAPPAPLPPCEGDACQSPGAPPEDQTPGSLSYQGPGNPPAPAASKPKTAAQLKAEKLKKALQSCRKKKSKQKRTACEAKARKLYGPHKAKKSKKAKKKSAGGKK